MKTVSAVLLAGVLAVASLGAWADRININEADAALLASLNGIGQAKAEAIIEYRKTNGPFRSVEDLAKVKGIGPAMIEKIREQLTVGEAANPRRQATANSQ